MNALILMAKNKPCTDCQIQLPPQIMDLDHVQGEKLFALGQWMKTPLLPEFKTRAEMIQAEIDKCEVRCPNCHRLRHFQEDPN